MDQEKHEQIAARAYALWQAEGQPDGRHEEHWYRAAREIAAVNGKNGAMKRQNSRPSSIPTTGVSGGAPAATKCSGVSRDASKVRTPTRLPGGNSRSTRGICIKDDAATGTSQCAASSFW